MYNKSHETYIMVLRDLRISVIYSNTNYRYSTQIFKVTIQIKHWMKESHLKYASY